jgi:hypothetical protein
MRWLLILCLLSQSSRADDWHDYLFSLDGKTLAPKSVGVETGAGYNGVTGSGAAQPDDARRVMAWVGAAIGVYDRIEIDGNFQFGDDPTNGFAFNQARLDVRVQVLKAHFPVAISIGAGYQADALLQNAITGVIAMTATLGRFDLTLNVRGAHYFHPGRDPFDIFVTAGALVRATHWLRLGAEYVGEELEPDDDDGGGRHYVGPTVVLLFLHQRLRVSATGGAVIDHRQLGPLARASIGYRF